MRIIEISENNWFNNFFFSFSLSYKYKIFKRKYIGTEEGKTKKHQETLNQQRNRKSLVTGEIYDRLLAAEIDSLSKLIRNGIFSFSHFVVCFSYSKVFYRVAWCLLFTQRFSIILIPVMYFITFKIYKKKILICCTFYHLKFRLWNIKRNNFNNRKYNQYKDFLIKSASKNVKDLKIFFISEKQFLKISISLYQKSRISNPNIYDTDIATLLRDLISRRDETFPELHPMPNSTCRCQYEIIKNHSLQ